MGMLARYQKSGGFIQLLQLIETCGKQKQDNFLQMIEKEDTQWAQAIREKMLTMEKIFSWDTAIVSEISARLHELTLATALHGLKPEDHERLLCTYTHSQKRNIDDLYKSKSPTPAEITSAFLKILQEVRSMIRNGDLRVEKFAPEMTIPENIEELLGKPSGSSDHDHDAVPNLDGFGASPAPSSSKSSATAPASGPSSGGATSDAEVFAMRKRIQTLTTENTQLKTEVRTLRDKLAQIKKIA